MSAVAALPAIGLAELTSRAALQTRVDRKHVLDADRLDLILTGVEPGTRVLEIDGERTFTYESVYFDTADLVSYHATAYRRRRRFKVRTRTYVDTAACYMEVKTRGVRGCTIKTRRPHDPAARETITCEAGVFTEQALHDADVPEPPEAQRLLPTLLTRYRRTTLYLPATDSRVTVDTDLVWACGHADCAVPAVTAVGLAVVETKTGSTPSSADRLLWRHGVRPTRISKYGTGMAALHDGLPATRWRRVIDRHLAGRLAPAAV